MTQYPILSSLNLNKTFKISGKGHTTLTLTALDQVSIQLQHRETIGIAGESGCGKSTLAKVMAGLLLPDSGKVIYKGNELTSLTQSEKKNFRLKTQMIFQDPFSSLNPRICIGDSISEPLIIAGITDKHRQSKVEQIMTSVGLPLDTFKRFPDEFSGGQRQRIGIARALAASPEILIADEPLSSLDISIQAQIINIMLQMKNDFALSMIIISHNLLILRHICDRIIIMYLGAVIESGPAEAIFSCCKHPYTEALIAAIPGLHKIKRQPYKLLQDDVPSPTSIPSGCRFHTRCRYAVNLCRKEVPELIEYSPGHIAACHFSNNFAG